MIGLSFALVSLALLTLVYLLLAVHGRSAGLNTTSELPQHTSPIDVEAFRNLVDADEDRFLQAVLDPAEYRELHRVRVLAAIHYVAMAWRNAGVLLAWGERARRSTDPEIARAGQQMVDLAIRFRIYFLPVVVNLWTSCLLPGAPVHSTALLDHYQKLKDVGVYLGRLQNAPLAARVSAVL